MAFLNIFQVPKTFTKKSLVEDLCGFGDVCSVFLTEDKNNKNVYFGGIDFIKLNDQAGLLAYLDKKQLQHSQIKPSNNRANRVSICKHKTIAHSQTNSIQNPSYNYYRDDDYGRNIENFIWSNQYNTLFKIDSADEIKLTTIYPGLLIGSGYNHPTKGNKDDYQLGFFFDHTTGLPLITGSSIKGVLRSLFEDDNKFGYLKEVYGITEERKAMQKRLFENGETIFYDAYIIDTDNEGKIFGSDYITSHYSDDPMGQFKEPNPVKFLKILPEVTWQFQFKAEAKDIELFKKIILDFGLGAKTNVGYGQFR